jgi:hypothetical protein
MEKIGTNTVVNRSFLVTSNWFFAGGYVASDNRGFPQAFVYARPRPGAGKAGQWIAPEGVSQEFGNSMAVSDGVLVVKDAGDTYFFRESNGEWKADGKIAAGELWGQRVGPVLIDHGFLISGSEVYRWPSREFVQTLNAPGVTGTPWSAVVVGSSLAMSFAPEGVWSFGYDFEAQRFSDGVRIRQPEDATNTAFGASLASWMGSDLFVGAPLDNTKGTAAGAVYVYRNMDPDGWRPVQKLTAALGMTGDQFGSTVRADEKRIYISAPLRNEAKQQAGAIFVYEMPGQRGVYSWLEKERITQHDGTDFGRLGFAMGVYQRMIYASSGGEALALHPPPMNIRFSRQGERALIFLPVDWDRIGTLESTDDLNATWQNQTVTESGTTLEATSTSARRFFRMRMGPAF